MWLSCGKVNSSAETWHYPLQAQDASSASSSTPFRTLPKFAFVRDCGEWWISGYCFTFLSESLGLSPSTRESRGSWQGFFGSSRMWIREKASHFFLLEERKNSLVQWKQRTGGIRWAFLLLDITAASSGKGDTWRLSSIYFFLPPHHKLSVFLALVMSCAHFVLSEGVERVPSQVEETVWDINPAQHVTGLFQGFSKGFPPTGAAVIPCSFSLPIPLESCLSMTVGCMI